MNNNHTLYNFRRCPYAMRARLALWGSGIIPETIIEVDFKNKPSSLMEISPKGTVPVLHLSDGRGIDESLDIVKWALGQNDPEGWMIDDADGAELIDTMTTQGGKFKSQLDRYKYPDRYPDEDTSNAQDNARSYLEGLNERLENYAYLCGDTRSYIDICIFPFIRQCANTNRDWFDALPLPALQKWLQQHLEWDLFQTIMDKNLS